MTIRKLYKVVNNDRKLLSEFDDFYKAIKSANSYKNIKVFELDGGEGQVLIGLRIHTDEIVWRIRRRDERGRDGWFHALHKLLCKIPYLTKR